MVISGYSEFLMETGGHEWNCCSAPAREIWRRGERATSLHSPALWPSAVKQMLAPRVLDLNALVTENLKMLNRLIGEDIRADPEFPGADFANQSKADSGQVEQVILNLAVNAR